jgi:proprotein convertase subtilisin/kexin type 5
VPCCATNATPEDQSCCHCDKDTGDCINSSPAGKRRIPIGVERQLTENADESSFYSGDLSSFLTGSTSSSNSDVGAQSPVFFVTVVTLSVCCLIVIVFVVIFSVLQRNSRKSTYTGIKYNKLNQNASVSTAMMATPLTSATSKKFVMPVDCDIEEFEQIDRSRNVDYQKDIDDDADDDDEVNLLSTDKDSILFYTSAERT